MKRKVVLLHRETGAPQFGMAVMAGAVIMSARSSRGLLSAVTVHVNQKSGKQGLIALLTVLLMKHRLSLSAWKLQMKQAA